MKRFAMICLLVGFFIVQPAHASEWRWAAPQFKKRKVTYTCNTLKCIRKTYVREKRHFKAKVARYNQRRLQEWKHWTHLYIPTCTWYGESGYGPEYSPVRYTMPNSSGSGAFGKFQFMASTYHANAKYHDWSPLDQEIAVRHEYWKHGTAPWENC